MEQVERVKLALTAIIDAFNLLPPAPPEVNPNPQTLHLEVNPNPVTINLEVNPNSQTLSPEP